METEAQSRLRELGLKEIIELCDIKQSKSFVVRTIPSIPEMIRIIPKLKKANLNSSHLLNLFGTHWHYETNPDSMKELHYVSGDVSEVLDNINSGIKESRHAHYAVPDRALNRRGEFWLFQDNTEGWEYFQDTVLPRFRQDQKTYISLKESTKENIKDSQTVILSAKKY